jgi:hypothetical protein
MAHVSDGWGDRSVLIFNEIVDLFVRGICARNEIVLVKIGVVGASYNYSSDTETTEFIGIFSQQTLNVRSNNSHY